MTKAEKIAKMAEHKALAEKFAQEYNEANDYVVAEAMGKAPEGVEKPRRLTEIAEDIERNTKEYNLLSLAVFYETCMEKDNPMLEAVTRLAYAVISAKDEKPDPESTFTVRTIKSGEKIVDLLAFYAKHQIGADRKWRDTAQQLNYLLTVDRAKKLGISADKLKTINSSYRMTAIAKDINLGKNPTAPKNLLINLQALVKEMLGDGYEVKEGDVSFLQFTYSTAGKRALAVRCANHKGFVQLIARMCHRIVTGAEYEIESKEVKPE